MARRRALLLLTAGALVSTPIAYTAALAPASATPFNARHVPAIQKRLMSNALQATVFGEGEDDRNADAQSSVRPRNYFPTDTDGCPVTRGSNVKVNQDCLNLTDPDLQGRGQAQNETAIAVDRRAPQHLVASYNDYRRGDGNCYAAYSRNGGRSWQDSTVPMSFTRGTAFGTARQYWQAGGDTSVEWDTKGNAYLSCQVFNRGAAGLTNNPDLSSAFYVFRSTGNQGASWNFPGRPVAESNNPNGKGVIGLEDKQLMTVDNHVGSPYQDRVYVSWTEFAANGTAYIYEAYSRDYAETFSKKVLVSRTTKLCTNTYGLPTPNGKCNENQFSQPFTGSDGALYVAYANFNNAQTGRDNRNQMLLARSTDGGRSFAPPVKVADYYDLPDCDTYQGTGQDTGRACVPEKGKSHRSVFRAINYPMGAVDPTDAKRVVVTFGSYINQHSNESNNCRPAGVSATGSNKYSGVKTAGACNNDILVSVSANGGRSFTGTTTDPRRLRTVNSDPRQNTTDQFFQGATYTNDGRFAVSYYDRQYGNDESNGYSDVSLSGTRNLSAWRVTRATTSSMPPPTQFTNAFGNGIFYGDYITLTAATDVHLIWSDTRDDDLFLCPGTGTAARAPRTCRATEVNGLTANDQNAYSAMRSRVTP